MQRGELIALRLGDRSHVVPTRDEQVFRLERLRLEPLAEEIAIRLVLCHERCCLAGRLVHQHAGCDVFDPPPRLLEEFDIMLHSVAHHVEIRPAVRVPLHVPNTVNDPLVRAVEAKIVERPLLALRHRRINRQVVTADAGTHEKRNLDRFATILRPRKRIGQLANFLGKVAIALEPSDVLRRFQIRRRDDDETVRRRFDVEGFDDFDVRRLELRPDRFAIVRWVGTESQPTTPELQLRSEPSRLLVIRMPHREIQRGSGILIDRRCQIAPRRDVARLQHLLSGRSEFRSDAIASHRIVRVPRRAIMVGEQVQVDRPVIAFTHRDSHQRLRPERQMIRHQLVIRCEKQAVQMPHIADTVLLLVLGQRERHVPGRQVRFQRLPCVFPIRDVGQNFEIKRLRRELLLSR